MALGSMTASPEAFQVNVPGVGGAAAPAAGGLGSLLGAAGPIGGLISGGLGLLGGMQSNKANAREADKNRQFQERMRATQYQTAVADLKAAGLNPMLAYTQGGAGTPSGSQAHAENAVSPAVSSAVAAANALASVGNMIADTTNKEAQTENIKADTALKYTTEALYGAQKYLTNAQTSSARSRAEVDAETVQAAIARARAEARLRQLEIPEKEQSAKFWGGLAGDFGKYIGPIKVILDILRGK